MPVKNYLPSARPPVAEDIEKLALVNPVIAAAISMFQNGDLTWEECLMTMVLCMAAQIENVKELLIDAAMKQKKE